MHAYIRAVRNPYSNAYIRLYLSDVFLPVGFIVVVVVTPALYRCLMRLMRRHVVCNIAAIPESHKCFPWTIVCKKYCALF